MAQWNKNNQDYLNQERSLFEVYNVATSDGEQVTETNRFPVSIGNTTVSIGNTVSVSGTVNIGTIPEFSLPPSPCNHLPLPFPFSPLRPPVPPSSLFRPLFSLPCPRLDSSHR